MSYNISSQIGNVSTSVHKTEKTILFDMIRERKEYMKVRAKVKIPDVTRTPGLGSLMDHCATFFCLFAFSSCVWLLCWVFSIFFVWLLHICLVVMSDVLFLYVGLFYVVMLGHYMPPPSDVMSDGIWLWVLCAQVFFLLFLSFCFQRPVVPFGCHFFIVVFIR